MKIPKFWNPWKRPKNETEEEVVDFCNSIRRRFGKPLRCTLSQGVAFDACECVVARTIGKIKGTAPMAGSSGIVITTKQGGIIDIVVPRFVQIFMEDFDGGKYKHLEDIYYMKENAKKGRYKNEANPTVI